LIKTFCAEAKKKRNQCDATKMQKDPVSIRFKQTAKGSSCCDDSRPVVQKQGSRGRKVMAQSSHRAEALSKYLQQQRPLQQEQRRVVERQPMKAPLDEMARRLCRLRPEGAMSNKRCEAKNENHEKWRKPNIHFDLQPCHQSASSQLSTWTSWR
jgi:hypothetical protein